MGFHHSSGDFIQVPSLSGGICSAAVMVPPWLLGIEEGQSPMRRLRSEPIKQGTISALAHRHLKEICSRV